MKDERPEREREKKRKIYFFFYSLFFHLHVLFSLSSDCTMAPISVGDVRLLKLTWVEEITVNFVFTKFLTFISSPRKQLSPCLTRTALSFLREPPSFVRRGIPCGVRRE